MKDSRGSTCDAKRYWGLLCGLMILSVGCRDSNEAGQSGDAGPDGSLDAGFTPAQILAGICSLESLALMGRKCQGADDYAKCAQDKCDAGGCAEACKSYLPCAGSGDHPCDPNCPISDECGSCLQKTLTCATSKSCTAALNCDVEDAGGPCDQIEACCNSITDAGLKSLCNQFLTEGRNFGGDKICAQFQGDPGTYCLIPCVLPDASVPVDERPECKGFVTGTSTPSDL